MIQAVSTCHGDIWTKGWVCVVGGHVWHHPKRQFLSIESSMGGIFKVSKSRGWNKTLSIVAYSI